MQKSIWVAGLLGGIAMFAWLFISNAVLPLKSDMIHQVAPHQFDVHQALKKSITSPGTYSVLYLTRDEEAKMPNYRDQPIYSITYEGKTHGDPGSIAVIWPLLWIFGATTVVSWMLSVTGSAIRSSYWRRLLFVMLIGLVVALSDDLLQMSFGPQPKDYLTFLAVNHLIAWTVAGLAIAAYMKPDPGAVSG